MTIAPDFLKSILNQRAKQQHQFYTKQAKTDCTIRRYNAYNASFNRSVIVQRFATYPIWGQGEIGDQSFEYSCSILICSLSTQWPFCFKSPNSYFKHTQGSGPKSKGIACHQPQQLRISWCVQNLAHLMLHGYQTAAVVRFSSMKFPSRTKISLFTVKVVLLIVFSQLCKNICEALCKNALKMALKKFNIQYKSLIRKYYAYFLILRCQKQWWE